MAFEEDFSRNVCRIRGIDLQIHAFLNPFAALAKLVLSKMADADDRCGLRHSVAGDERQLELLHEKFLELLRNCRSSGGEQFNASAESLVKDDSQGIAEVRIVPVVFEFGCSALAVDELTQSVLDQLGKNERHGEEYVWFVFTQCRF